MSLRISQLQADQLDEATALRVVDIYRNNYPSAHSSAQREADLGKRDTPEKIQALAREAILLVARDVKEEVQAVLEYSAQELDEGVYVVLAWMLVDQALQGQGISSALHRVFEAHATTIKERLGKPTAQLLSVHRDNPAKDIYTRWGYQTDEREHPTPGMVFMYRDVETSGEKAVRLIQEWQPSSPERAQAQFDRMLLEEGYTTLRALGEIIRGIYDLDSVRASRAERELYPVLRKQWMGLRAAYMQKATELGLGIESALPELPEEDPRGALSVIRQTIGAVDGVALRTFM